MECRLAWALSVGSTEEAICRRRCGAFWRESELRNGERKVEVGWGARENSDDLFRVLGSSHT